MTDKGEWEKRGKVRMLLWDWGQALDIIAKKQEERKAFEIWAEDAADTLKSQELTGMPSTGECGDGGVFQAVLELEKRQKMFEEASTDTTQKIEAILRRKLFLDGLIEELTVLQQKILRLRYVDGHKWRFIALKLSYVESRIRDHESNAVAKLSESIDFAKLEKEKDRRLSAAKVWYP